MTQESKTRPWQSLGFPEEGWWESGWWEGGIVVSDMIRYSCQPIPGELFVDVYPPGNNPAIVPHMAGSTYIRLSYRGNGLENTLKAVTVKDTHPLVISAHIHKLVEDYLTGKIEGTKYSRR